MLEPWEPLCGGPLYVVCKLKMVSLIYLKPKYLVSYQRCSSADWTARKGVRDNRWAQDYGWKKVIGLNLSLENSRKMLRRAQESQYDLQKEYRG